MHLKVYLTSLQQLLSFNRSDINEVYTKPLWDEAYPVLNNDSNESDMVLLNDKRRKASRSLHYSWMEIFTSQTALMIYALCFWCIESVLNVFAGKRFLKFLLNCEGEPSHAFEDGCVRGGPLSERIPAFLRPKEWLMEAKSRCERIIMLVGVKEEMTVRWTEGSVPPEWLDLMKEKNSPKRSLSLSWT